MNDGMFASPSNLSRCSSMGASIGTLAAHLHADLLHLLAVLLGYLLPHVEHMLAEYSEIVQVRGGVVYLVWLHGVGCWV